MMGKHMPMTVPSVVSLSDSSPMQVSHAFRSHAEVVQDKYHSNDQAG